MKYLKGKNFAQQKKNLIIRLLKLGVKKSDKTKGHIHSIATLKMRNIVFDSLVKFLENNNFLKTLTEVDEDLLIEFFEVKINKGLTSKSLINILATISSSFNALGKQGLEVRIKDFTKIRNICKNIAKKSLRRNRAINVKNLAKVENKWAKIMAKMQLETGFRLNELYQISIDKIKYSEGKYYIKGKSIQGKGGKLLVTKVVSKAVALLFKHMLILHNNTMPFTKVTYNKYYKKAFGDTSHSCRYNFIQSLNKKLNKKQMSYRQKKLIIAEESGHVRATSANHYSY